MAHPSVAPLISKVEKLLGSKLSGFRSGIEPAERADRVLGFVVSSDFEGLDHGKRQRILKEILKRGLTIDELLRIGPIITMTPAESSIDGHAA